MHQLLLKYNREFVLCNISHAKIIANELGESIFDLMKMTTKIRQLIFLKDK